MVNSTFLVDQKEAIEIGTNYPKVRKYLEKDPRSDQEVFYSNQQPSFPGKKESIYFYLEDCPKE